MKAEKPVRCGCGGEAYVDCYLGCINSHDLYYVYCDKCYIQSANYKTVTEAIKAWNTAMGAKDTNVPDKVETDNNVGDKWIPVSERLPENDDDVLLQFESNMGVGYYHEEDGWSIATGENLYSGVDDCEDKPIAWMPLPEPWRGEKE